MNKFILNSVMAVSAAALICGFINPTKALATSAKSPASDAQAPARGSAPMYEAAIAEMRATVAEKIKTGVDVPVPHDGGGGYTHETHKQNATLIYDAGMLYRLTGDKAYVDFADKILMDYARLYPSLGKHPLAKDGEPGVLFWQNLNDSVWLVTAIQGYDEIRSALPAADRILIEKNVFLKMANFLSEGSPQTFNLIHNHGTWACAAVGMTGYVLNDQGLVKKALYGLDGSGKAGFLKQIDELFSPDGYYTEGPYYERYALMPFLLFAKAIDAHDPSRKVYAYRESVLLRAVNVTIQQTYGGRFFPINDAIPEKSLDTPELLEGVATAYGKTGDKSLLSIAQLQGRVASTLDGEAVAKAVADGLAQPFNYKSMVLHDGPQGKDGALIILRSGPQPDSQTAVLKATSQGMGHGHFDKLNLLYYDNGEDILADYGSARFQNIDTKRGGGYLPENTSWAKQTVAHNTLVVDETSDFDGKVDTAQKFSPDRLDFEAHGGVQIASAHIDTAYPGVDMKRVTAMFKRPGSDRSYLLDLFRATSGKPHEYDLPFHFKGQLIDTSFAQNAAVAQWTPLGTKAGYQHLWKRAESAPLVGEQAVSWLQKNRFYTLSFAATGGMKAIFTKLGANDPENNLVDDQALILRVNAPNAEFLSVLEGHGSYDVANETTDFDSGTITGLADQHIDAVSVITVSFKDNSTLRLLIPDDLSADLAHTVSLSGHEISWTGGIHVLP